MRVVILAVAAAILQTGLARAQIEPVTIQAPETMCPQDHEEHRITITLPSTVTSVLGMQVDFETGSTIYTGCTSLGLAFTLGDLLRCGSPGAIAPDELSEESEGTVQVAGVGIGPQGIVSFAGEKRIRFEGYRCPGVCVYTRQSGSALSRPLKHGFLSLRYPGGQEYTVGFSPTSLAYSSDGQHRTDELYWDERYCVRVSAETFRRVRANVLASRLSQTEWNLGNFNCIDWMVGMLEPLNGDGRHILSDPEELKSYFYTNPSNLGARITGFAEFMAGAGVEVGCDRPGAFASQCADIGGPSGGSIQPAPWAASGGSCEPVDVDASDFVDAMASPAGDPADYAGSVVLRHYLGSGTATPTGSGGKALLIDGAGASAYVGIVFEDSAGTSARRRMAVFTGPGPVGLPADAGSFGGVLRVVVLGNDGVGEFSFPAASGSVEYRIDVPESGTPWQGACLVTVEDPPPLDPPVAVGPLPSRPEQGLPRIRQLGGADGGDRVEFLLQGRSLARYGLRVFDVAGRVVWRTEGTLDPAGARRVTWRPSEREHGTPPASSILFARLDVDGDAATAAVVWIR